MKLSSQELAAITYAIKEARLALKKKGYTLILRSIS
jgi:hypothetical protein